MRHRQLVTARLARVCRGLQLDRRLALVRDAGAQSAERCDGVEQAAHARGQRCREAGTSHALDRVPALLADVRDELRGRFGAGLQQPRAGHPPRLAHGCVAAGQAHRPEVPRPLEAAKVAGEDLAAPDRPVGAQSRPVEDRADRRPALTMLGEAGGEMRVVVLNPRQANALALLRIRGRAVVGMQIVGHDGGIDGEQPLEVRDPLCVGAHGLGVAEVADVVPDPGAAPACHAGRALELRATGQDRLGAGDRHRQALRDVAPRAPQQLRASTHDTGDRVVRAHVDRAVVDEEGVGDLGETFPRILVAVRDRLVGDVAAREHEHASCVREQQVVQGRVGQHHAELTRGCGHGRGDASARRPRRQHDRAGAGGEKRLGLGVEHGELAHRGDVGSHQRERLVLTVLA